MIVTTFFYLLANIGWFFNYAYCNTDLEDSTNNTNTNSLVLLHVIFRHGDRTPDIADVYPNDPYINYTYSPFGYGQLTEKGKLKEYMIGKALRSRYGKFLGNYDPNMIYARSTDYTRTKISCELVMAGLFPPNQNQRIDKELNWQPILCDYEHPDVDFLHKYPNIGCPNYKKMFNYNLQMNKDYYDKKNKELYDYVALHSGLNIVSPFRIFQLNLLFEAQTNLGFKLPDWVNDIYPTNTTDVAVDVYELMTANKKTRRLSGGHLLKRVFDDTVSKINEGDFETQKKIYLYSIHENTIAIQLKLLNVFFPHVPPYGAYLLYEIHKTNDSYGFKILYQNYTVNGKLKVLRMPGCKEICPIEQFKKLYEDQFATKKDVCDEKVSSTLRFEGKVRTGSIFLSLPFGIIYLIIIVVMIYLFRKHKKSKQQN